MFSGGELWATNEPARDRSGVCKGTTQTEVQGLHHLRFEIDYVEVFGFQSEHRQAFRVRGPFIFRQFDVGSVSVLDNISCFHAAWGLLTMRWYIVHCRFHNPDQRATTAMPCSSVSRGEYITLNLGQVCITSNLVDAALPTPQRPTTDPNPNPDDVNLNPTRNATPDIW